MIPVADGSIVRTLKGHADGVSSVCVSPDGRHIVSGGYDHTVRIWPFADLLPPAAASDEVSVVGERSRAQCDAEPGAATGGLEGVCMMVTGWGSKFLPDLPFTLCRNENLGKTDEQKKTLDMLFSSVRALQKCAFRRLNVKG